jgi:hypothetical protein
MDTKQEVTWKDLGDRFPDLKPTTRFEVDDYDTGERSLTKLSVSIELMDAGTLTGFESQTVQYECAHGRVNVYVEALGEDIDPDLGARLALTLHAWGLDCDCFRGDWRLHFGEAANGRSLAAARRWAVELAASKLFTALRATWHSREPVGQVLPIARPRSRRSAA